MSTPTVPTTADLARDVQGPVLTRGDAGFDEEIAAFNPLAARSPEIVVGATCAADVVAAVRWAAERVMPVGVQATGHGWAAGSGGLLLTTARMQELDLDPATGLLRVGAGVKWRSVLDAGAASGWAAPCGSSSDVGVVGYTLGGGLPVLGRAFGFAADRVTAIEIVTAAGELRRVTADSDPELFWAVRGGGGGLLGVITALEMTLPRLDGFHGGGLFFPGDAAAEVLPVWAEWSRDLPEAMSTSLALLRLPAMPGVPEPLAGRLVVHVRIAYAGDADRCEALLAPLRSLSVPTVMDTVAEHPYAALDLVHMDPDQPVPFRDAGCLLASLPPAAVDRLTELAGPGSDSPLLAIELRRLGGALSRTPSADLPFGGSVLNGRSAAYSLHAVGLGIPPVAELLPGALTTLLDAMRGWGDGTSLLNLHGRATGDTTPLTGSRAPLALARLAAVKSTVDPGNLFRLGHPIA